MARLGELLVDFRGDSSDLRRAARESQDSLEEVGDEAAQTGEEVRQIGDKAEQAADKTKQTSGGVSSVLGDWRVQALAAAAAIVSIVDAVAELDQRTQQIGPLADLLGVPVELAQVLNTVAEAAGIEGGALELSEITAQLSEYALLVTAQQDERAAGTAAEPYAPVSEWDTPTARALAARNPQLRKRLEGLIGAGPAPPPEVDEERAADITDYAAAFERLGIDPRVVTELEGHERITYLQEALAASRLERPGSYAFDLAIIAGDQGARGLSGLARSPVTVEQATRDLMAQGLLATEEDIDAAEAANYQRALGRQLREGLKRSAFEEAQHGAAAVGRAIDDFDIPFGTLNIPNPISGLANLIERTPVLGDLAEAAISPLRPHVEITIDPAAAAAGVQARARDAMHDGTLGTGRNLLR